MTPKDQERGRGAGVFRDLAPIAAAAGAAALTVALVVGPTTARLRSVTSETSPASHTLGAAGRPGPPKGDIRVQVRPRPAPAAGDLTAVFDLVRAPDAPPVRASASPLAFVIPVRSGPASTVSDVLPISAPDTAVIVDGPVAVPAPATAPAPALSVVLLPPPQVTTADAPTKRPSKPLRPVTEHSDSRGDNPDPMSTEQASGNAETRTTRAEERAAEREADLANGNSADRPDDKRIDRSKK